MNNNPMAPGANYGFNYGMQRTKARSTQPLSEQQIQMLRSKVDALDMKISEVDVLRAMCTHKNKDGSMATTQTVDGHCHCAICNSDFNIVDMNTVDINKKIDDVIDIVQTFKLLYLDAPEDFIKNYSPIINLLEKLKVIFPKAVDNFSQYDLSDQSYTMQQTPYAYQNGFAGLASIFNPFAARPAQQPYQPQYQQAPQQPNGFYTGYDPNPMAYGQPQYQYQPQYQPQYQQAPMQQAPAPGVMPQQAPQQVPVQQQEAASDEVTQTKVMNV